MDKNFAQGEQKEYKLVILCILLILVGCTLEAEITISDNSSQDTNYRVINSFELPINTQFVTNNGRDLVVFTRRDAYIYETPDFNLKQSVRFGWRIWFTTYYQEQDLLIFYDGSGEVFYVWDLQTNALERIIPRSDFNIDPHFYLKENTLIEIDQIKVIFG
ncbi:MAG: hypothetical protein QNJ45_26220 [Ardenticatenaceae bacterium]|nr:hypothetical protein [Ardenticatenaceae bacterium]